MSVCVSAICNLPILKNKIQLIAGENGLSKVVHHVTVMEVPDFPDKNLVNGIFILTTFYSYRNDINLMVEAVNKLAKKKISGIAIKINRFITETPPKIIEIANKNNIPLFVINDQNLSFSKIISAISSEIINYQFSILKEINEQQDLLNNAILNDENISKFLKIISNQIQFNSICISYEGKILAEYSITGEQSKDDIQLLIQEINTIGINIKDMLSSHPYISIRDYYVFPCIGHNQVLGYFSLQKQSSISERELFLAQQMVSFLSIKLLEKYLLLENEQRMTNVIINELLFHEYLDESVVKERLHFLGFIPNTYYRIIMFSLNGENYNKDFYNLKIKLASLSRYLKGIFPNSIITLIGDGFIAIVPIPRVSKFIKNENLKISLDNMEEKLNFLSDMSIGYSPVQSDLRLIPNYFKSVKQAIKFGRAFNTEGHIYCYDDFPTVKLVSHMLNTEEYSFVKNTIILPLKEYDEKYKSELELTLEKCLTNDTLEKAAAELHIHSSTLRYRLQKIKNLTNVDYFSMQGKYLLNTAYIISKLDPYSL